MGRSPTHRLEIACGPVAPLGVRIALRALGRASRLGKGTGCVLALLATNGHAEERWPEPVAPGVFYVSATVVADGAGGPRERGTAVASATAECGWDDPPPGATVGCVAPVAEGARQRIVIRRVDAEGEPVAAEADLEFPYRTTPISATADADYLSASGTLTIKAGEFVSSPATFTTLDDVLDEFQEAFAVELGNDPESPLELEFDYVVIPIRDNDPEVRVSMKGAEGAEDAGILSFEVSLSGTSGKTVIVDYGTSDGTATADADYQPAAGTLTFEPGEVVRTVEVSVIDDAIHEPAEWFALALANARNARLPRAPARGTIRDDDALLMIVGASAGEASGGLEFVVTATGLVAGDAPATVNYATEDGTATAGADYEPVSGTLTFTAERAEQVVAVSVVDDAVDEPDETLVVVLTDAANATIGTATAVGVIEDDDPVPEIEISGGSALEGETIGFVVTLSGSTARTVTVDYATSDGIATADADYRSAAGTLTFEPGEVARTVEVSVIDDAIHEPAEWFELALANARNARLPRAPGRGIIRDNDALLTITGARAGEASGRLEFVVTATGIGAGNASATVDYATEDRTAIAGDDYDPVSGTLTFTAERAEQVVAVSVVDDAVDEPDETLAVVLTDAANGMIGTATAVGVIVDDDPVPELRISGGTASEGEMIGFVVTLSGSTARTVTVDYATTDGSATAGADYGSVSGRFTFAPGESSATVSVDLVDDETYEPDETFVARLSSPVNAVIVTGEATGTILDNDEQPAAVAVLPEDPMLCVGGAPARIDLSRHFSGDGLSYAVSDPDPSVATASLDGIALFLTPVAEGTTSVTVTAANMGSQATFELTVTVVADPAELAAIERGLAVAGGAILADVIDAIGGRFVDAGASDRGSNASPPAPSALEDRSAANVFGAEWVANPGGFAAREVSEAWPPAPPLDNMPLASGSLAFSAIPHTGAGNWSVWGRGSTRRFGDGELLEDGSLTALQVGADARVGEWLLGAAAGLARTEAEYGFMRSVDACGGAGAGEGVLETEILSVHPYVGRRVGRGWVWGTAGAGGGEAVVERCASGHRTAADLSMRMGALGGRHLIRGSQRVEVSLVEDVGVLRATTEAAIGPAGDHDISVGRARLGVEVSGVCATGAGIVGWIRAFGRRDWGDGIEGSGAEVALGARLDAPEKRVRLEASAHAVAAHTEDDYEERGANVAAAYLSRSDGTGLQASMTLRRGAPEEMSRLGESWRLSSGPRDARRGMRGDVFVGFGFRALRGLARPFAALGTSSRGRRVAAGLRYEALGGQPGFMGEFSIGHRQGSGDGGFVMARFEARR